MRIAIAVIAGIMFWSWPLARASAEEPSAGMMGTGGMMMSGEMMGMKSKQMASMSEMMKSMGDAMELQAKSMKGSNMKARRDSMMKVAKEARSVSQSMKRMSAGMAKMEGMGSMKMHPRAGEMMNKSMASEREAMQMMQKEVEATPGQ